MKYPELRKLKDRLYFTVYDLAQLIGITQPSARVMASRYTTKGLFVRLKNNFYCLTERWENFTKEDFLMISNVLQVPSYVSLATALQYYDISTQVSKDYFENISIRRSRKFEINGVTFNYYKIRKEFYFGFLRKEKVFVAEKEKAFIDSLYLLSFGKYSLDIDSIDTGKLDKDKLSRLIKPYPQKAKKLLKEVCKI